MKRIIICLICILTISQLKSQNDLGILISSLLADTPIEEDLQELCDEIGGRVTGTASNEKAVDWALNKFLSEGITAEKDPFEMPVYWHEKSTSASIKGTDFAPLVVAKYQTPPGIYSHNIVWVGRGTSEEFDQLGINDFSDLFVMVETDLCLDIDGLFAEYAHATMVEMEAYKRNVAGVIFMSSRPQKLLYHFLTMKATENSLPQFVMAREDAQRCARILQDGQTLEIHVEANIDTGDSFTSHNVIAEIKGSEKPDEVVIIGSHIDSWALGTGANDNGCNVALMIDIARQMKRRNIKPKRTIRFALWNGEEQGYFGSWDYTKDHIEELDNHIMALSVDIGSGALTGFFTNGREEMVHITDEVLKPVAALGDFTQINAPIVGTDNFDFMLQGVPNLVGNHKPQVYGVNYHASSDTYDKVDLKQLKINSAIVASLAIGYANLDDESAAELQRHNRSNVEKLIEQSNLEFTMRMFNVWDSWAKNERGIQD